MNTLMNVSKTGRFLNPPNLKPQLREKKRSIPMTLTTFFIDINIAFIMNLERILQPYFEKEKTIRPSHGQGRL